MKVSTFKSKETTMKKINLIFALTLSICFLTTGVFAQKTNDKNNNAEPENSAAVETANIAGKWILTLAIPGQEPGMEMTINLDFKQEADKLAGEMTSRQGNGEITGGKVTGNKFTAVIKVQDVEQNITISVKGTVDGVAMEAEILIGNLPDSLPFSGSRAK